MMVSIISFQSSISDMYFTIATLLFMEIISLGTPMDILKNLCLLHRISIQIFFETLQQKKRVYLVLTIIYFLSMKIHLLHTCMSLRKRCMLMRKIHKISFFLLYFLP